MEVWYFLLVSCVEESHSGLYKAQQWKQEVKGSLEREIKSSLLILDLKDGRLQDSGKEEGKIC